MKTQPPSEPHVAVPPVRVRFAFEGFDWRAARTGPHAIGLSVTARLDAKTMDLAIVRGGVHAGHFTVEEEDGREWVTDPPAFLMFVVGDEALAHALTLRARREAERRLEAAEREAERAKRPAAPAIEARPGTPPTAAAPSTTTATLTVTPAVPYVFEGKSLRVRLWRGRPCVVAQEFGAVLGYADGARLVDQIRGPWKGELIDGVDSAILAGADLVEWKRLSPESGESRTDRTPSLLVLFEPGMYLAAIKARTAAGSRVRRWLASDVLPSILRTGRYERPTAPTERAVAHAHAPVPALPRKARESVPIGEALGLPVPHLATGLGWLDELLGGGFVPCASMLLSGDPGAGKSTLLLAAAEALAVQGHATLYVTSEESAVQVGARGARIGTTHPRVRVLAAETLTDVTDELARLGAAGEVPRLVALDSVQELALAPATLAGTTRAMLGITDSLRALAAQEGFALVLVGHAVKTGRAAGVLRLVHKVDMHAHLALGQGARILTVHKNRHGTAPAVAELTMTERGLQRKSGGRRGGETSVARTRSRGA